MGDYMYALNLLLRLLTAVCIIFLFFKVYNQKNTKKMIINRIVLLSHILFLGLYFLNLLDLHYFLFDVIWWSMAGIGIICCMTLLKNRSFILFLLVPTTIFFLSLIPLLLLLDNM